jgi:hypothetical protein
MSASTAPYTPTITEVQSLTKYQRRLAEKGFRGFWVEASGKTIVHGMRVARYLLTLMPSGYIKCPCEARKWNQRKDCSHIEALKVHLEKECHKQRHNSPRLSTVIAQAESVAAKAERALPVDQGDFSIYHS